MTRVGLALRLHETLGLLDSNGKSILPVSEELHSNCALDSFRITRAISSEQNSRDVLGALCTVQK